MLLLLKNEMSKISKMKLFFIWIGALVSISTITGIIIMGLGTDGKLDGIVSQNVVDFNITGNQWSGWGIGASLFSVLFTKAVFLLFEAYLISNMIIDEFRRRTINQLFSYPIRKSQIMWSKIILVCLISFVGQLSAHLVIQVIIKLIAATTGVSDLLTFNFIVNLLLITLGTVLVGLLPLVLGVMKYSTIITMLSALALAGIISNAMPGALSKSFVNSLPFLILTSLVSIIIVIVSVSKVSKKDVSIY
ncbi:MAG: ABC transporter permease [Culicoidibacterales bacterium]